MDRMEVKRDIYKLWLQYKAKNEDDYFHQFVRGFVAVWEEQLPLDWSSLPNWTDIRPDAGPHLSRLPEELLSAVSHFMQEARSDTEKRTLNCESLSDVELLTHLLTILARNLDNIPLVASCDYVSISIGIAATVIHQLVEESAHFGEAGVSFFTSVCHLLEVLYDPYFTWRHFLRGNEADFEKIAFQPALLHVEVVPFIYDCFETSLIESYPHLGSQLIHVLGAVVSGAQSIIVQLDPVFPSQTFLAEQVPVKSDKANVGLEVARGLSKTNSSFCLSDGHNALRAICPATVNMIMTIVSNADTPPELRYHALQCFVLMARVLLKSAPDQRQIEVGTMVQLVREVLLRGVKEETWTPDSVHAFSQIVSAMRCLLVQPPPPKRGHAHHASHSHAQALHAHMQQLLMECQIPDALLLLLKESANKNVEKQSLAVEVVRVMSALLAGSNTVKERLLKADLYSRLAEALRSLGDPRRPLLRALLAFSTEEDGPSSSESESALKNGHALLILLRWLPAVPDVDQVWLAENIAKLCNASLQSRVVCSSHKVILEICSLMEHHTSLSRPAVGELLGLLEGLASHCITPLELKSIFLLLRDGDLEEKCPYHSQLLHAISAVARRGEHSDCHYFFDIQNDTDGLSVPGIRKWPGAGYGFSFHCWVKLDSEAEAEAESNIASPTSPSPAASPASPASRSLLSPMMAPSPTGTATTPTSPAASRVGVGNRRRQLFNLLTSNNTGVEIFFRADGMLVVAISTKKEFLTATVPDVPLADNRWHCIGVCITMARRPFGHNQVQVFIDGSPRLAASIKFPSMSEPFTYCTIGSVVQRGAAMADVSSRLAKRSQASGMGMLERAAGAGGSLFPSLINQVPSYLSLPLPLRNSAPLDPNVKSFQAGLQDAVWGSPGCLRGQLSTTALLQDALSPPQARLLYQQGPNWRGLFSSEEGADLSELVGRLVFCFSPAACWDNLCLDLAPGNKYDGHVVATQCSTLGVKTAINGIGGIHVVFPILEQAGKGKVGEEVPVIPSSQRSLSITASGTGSIVQPSEDLDDWEVLPSSSYADWKLELNPVSGFLSYLRNLLLGSPLNQEHLLRNHGAAILGHLLSQVKPSLLDVHVLMVAQLLLEMARDAGHPGLLRSLHQHVLFNFHIWSRGPFHIRIGHIQYISSVIKEDRKSFRKRYGVQFLLDSIRTHHSAPGDLVGADDGRALRLAILRLIRYYISKEVNVKEVTAIVGFLCSVKEEILVLEVLEMLILHLEGQCKDQLFLLLFEPHAADLLYCLLIDRRFSMDLKQKVLKLTSVLLRTDRVYEMHKKRLRLQDTSAVLGLVASGIGMYPGLIALLGDQKLSMEVAAMLLDQMLLSETPASYAAALALLHSLSLADLDIKVEAARKILTTLFMRPNAPATVAKQVGWQDCVSRLLVKRPISTAPISISADDASSSLPDLMTFDEDAFELDLDKTSPGPSSLIHRSHSPSSVSRISASVSDAASVLESEIKDVAESVTLAIGDNIQYAADNITSFMGSAYSVFRQKTVEMQESLEGLSESAVHRLKNGRSGSSLSERLSSVDSASVSPGNRSRSSSSSEDVSSAAAESSRSRASVSSTVTDGGAQSSVQPPADADSDTEEQKEALRQWVALDADRQGDREEDLCNFVLNILFTVLWRGVETGSRDCWRERGQVMACINLLGLNNELHGSHLQLKLRLLEMSVQAALSDLRESASSASTAGSGSSGVGAGPSPPHASAADNAAQLLRWVYDLVVLDPNPDCSKKVSTKLLDGVLGLLDALLVFQEGPQEEWTEMAKLSFGVLLACAAGPQLDLCAMATAKLHALVQTRRHAAQEESAYLLFYLDGVVQDAIRGENQEHYSFLIPVVKALVEKLSSPLCIPQYCLDLPSTSVGPVFFEEFQSYCQGDQWRQFVDLKVKPLHDSYKAALSSQLTEAMNTFWAECYEASKTSALKRHREVAASKIRFQEQIGVPYRVRAAEDSVRYSNLQSQQRNRQLLVRRQWRTTSSFLSGPRGAWRIRTPEERHWKLSHHENYSRMRLKLCPSLAFHAHTDASNLRDNTGWLSRRRSSETPLALSSWSAAVRAELDDDALPEEDLRSLQAEPEPAEEVTREEKLVLSQECELVTLMTSVRGKLELTTTHASFHDLSPLQEDGERQDFRWPLSRLREVHLRRYNLRRSALEFFLMDQTNYFVNFTPKTRNKVYSRIIGLRPPNLTLSSSRSPAEMLRASGLTQKWINREISNFDYLMQLNTIAGRSYNDLSQYPVFPWIIADYTSPELDLENPATFRDLSRPIGVVNPKNVAEVKAKYDNFEDPSGVIAKFHYGTHYSNSAGVLHYLVRVEPFTSLHIELQSGRFDVADRQFHSIPQTWKLLMDNPNDVKELTPEFFYFPEFLKNLNGFDLGLLQGTKERVNDVALPAWASSPEDFIFKHRRALECEYVSAHLHEWIDLIFGYKQKGPKAVEALNVFYYCSYEGAVDLDALKSAVEREAMEGMINNFGQTPCQLLREPHPQRLSLSESASRQLRPDLTQHLDKIRPFTIMELTSDRDAVAFVSPPRSPPRSFLTAALPDVVVTVTRSGVVGVHSWLPVDRHSPRGFSFEVDPSVSNPKIRKKLPAPPHPAVPASSHLFCVSHDGKVLLSGGHWDCSLRGWSISRGRPLFSVVRHFDLVTCVALDRCGWFLVTGSRDTTCVVWDLAGGSGASDSHVGLGSGIGALGVVTGGTAGVAVGGPSNPAAPKPIQTLYGHDAAVTCVAIMTELDMVVSGSSDGTVNVHTIREGQYLRTLHPVGCVDPHAEVAFLTLSHLGHIAFTANDKASNSVHVYSVNGVHLGSKYVSGRVTGLVTVGENVVVVDDAGDLTISRLYGLRPIYDVPLHVPVQTIVVTPSNTHLLLPLRDGNLVVVGVPPHGSS